MPADPPVDFQQLAQGPRGQTNGDYPYAIKARDLMKNFVFATLEVEEGIYEETTGLQGHRQRKLKISPGQVAGQIMYWDGSRWIAFVAPPNGGTFVLGARNGTLTWIATEACE